MKNEALERLYKKYYNEAMLYVYSFCRNRTLAEDIVAEAYFRAFRRIDEEKDSFKYWLFKVCRNCYFDYLRKTKRTENMDDIEPIDDSNLVEEVIQNEEYIALYNAISLLKGNYQEVIRLFYFDGLSIREIAGITDMSEDNVKVLLYRARIKLKEIMEAKNEF